MRSIVLKLAKLIRRRVELPRRRAGGSSLLHCAVSPNNLKIGAQFPFHHLVERKVFGCVSEAVRCAMRRQFRIGYKFQDSRRQCLRISWFDKETVLAMANNLWNIADFRSDDGAS